MPKKEIGRIITHEEEVGDNVIITRHIRDDTVEMAQIRGIGGFGSNAGLVITVYHNLGEVPPRDHIFITPRANANYWITAVNASALEITTNTSGVGCDWRVFRP